MPLFTPDSTQPKTPQTEAPENPKVPDTPVVEMNTNIPDISFIVEDGSIVPLANSYCTLDYADEYTATKGYSDWLQLSDEEKKVSLIRGTEFVNNFYTWRGKRTSQTQSLAFPRNEIFDDDGFKVIGIPENLKKACVEASFILFSGSTESLFSVKDENGNIKRNKVDSLEVEYFEQSQISEIETETGRKLTSVYDILNYMLRGLYVTAGDMKNSNICSRGVWI